MSLTHGDGRTRCRWAGSDPLYLEYHDHEWGSPSRDDRHLLEMLVLEGAQAGLSWITILRKRENYRRAFDNFEPAKLAKYDERRIGKLLADTGIVRNRMKIDAAIGNARAFRDVVQEYGSFHAYVWDFVNGQPIVNRWQQHEHLPAQTPESEAMSKALRQRGFRFVGPTICYSFMQAVGMVNDHVVDCFRWAELGGQSGKRPRTRARS